MNAQPPVVADATATDDARPHRLFITGANGYVGRNLTRHFLQKGVEVVVLVRSAQAAERMKALGAVPVIGDLFMDALTEEMTGCDALIHAARPTPIMATAAPIRCGSTPKAPSLSSARPAQQA
ncbi:NAD(P)H-binding protein [Brevundimonas sp. NPDC003935]|uniref:NAD(P)H-binding protein n=1 Tax=unclassified Brevundimonas TaxID=2622653 RepID=UPI00289B72C1|nr:NAD(P)H-binding protein [Brevundimonas sp.]